MDQDFAARLVFEDLSDEEYAAWKCLEEGEADSLDDARGWYQIWENNDQYWRIDYYTSYYEEIDEGTITFRQVERKEKVVIFYD